MQTLTRVVECLWWTNGKQVGLFVVALEAEGGDFNTTTSALLSGLWLGEASPDASLKGFGIPTNPIRWVLSCTKRPAADVSTSTAAAGATAQPTRGAGAPAAMPPPAAVAAASTAAAASGAVPPQPQPAWATCGAGCFSDSGDVPGQPILRFTLNGSYQPDAPCQPDAPYQPDAPCTTARHSSATPTALPTKGDEALQTTATTSSHPPDQIPFLTDARAVAAAINLTHPTRLADIGAVAITKVYEATPETVGYMIRQVPLFLQFSFYSQSRSLRALSCFAGSDVLLGVTFCWE
jgi:hypothetical protein